MKPGLIPAEPDRAIDAAGDMPWPPTSANPLRPSAPHGRGVALHERLREASVAFHRRLDGLPGMARLMSPDLTVSEYLACLSALEAAHVPVERAVEAFLAASPDAVPGFDFAPRRKAHLIALDRAHFGDTSSVDPAGVFFVENEAELAGYLYVVEGSMLGGRVIARRIDASLGATAERGGSFFNAYGARTDGLWADFWSRVSAAVAPEDAPVAVAAARAAFVHFEQTLSTADDAISPLRPSPIQRGPDIPSRHR